MKIWELRHDVDNYLRLRLANRQEHWEKLTYGLNGIPIKATWTKLEVQIDPYAETQNNVADFPDLSGVLVVTPQTLSVISDLLEKQTELLPLVCVDGIYDELYIANVITVLDCLDHKRSDLKYFDDGRVMWIYQHVFNMECVGNTSIFKIKEQHNRIYVNDIFKQTVEENGLTGLRFLPI